MRKTIKLHKENTHVNSLKPLRVRPQNRILFEGYIYIGIYIWIWMRMPLQTVQPSRHSIANWIDGSAFEFQKRAQEQKLQYSYLRVSVSASICIWSRVLLVFFPLQFVLFYYFGVFRLGISHFSCLFACIYLISSGIFTFLLLLHSIFRCCCCCVCFQISKANARQRSL